MDLSKCGIKLLELPDGNARRPSACYEHFLVERAEILRHKWIESEKAGFDIGFERALVDWTKNHRARWFATRADRSRRLTARSDSGG